jgi:tetratricopeptide (TPR) repeat protein
MGSRTLAEAASSDELRHKGWLVSMEMYKDPSALEKARGLFLEAQKLNPNDASLFYYIAYTYFKEGEFALIHDENKEMAIKLYEKALGFAEEGLKLDPENIECRFGRAACLSRILDTKYSKKSMLRNMFSLASIMPKLRTVKGDIEFVLSNAKKTQPRIQEAYDYAYIVMVMKAGLDWFYPGILGGSKEKALDRLMEAQRRHPEDSLPYYTKARLYLELDEDYERAKECCEKVVNCQNPYAFFDHYAFYRLHCEKILGAIRHKTVLAKPSRVWPVLSSDGGHDLP